MKTIVAAWLVAAVAGSLAAQSQPSQTTAEPPPASTSTTLDPPKTETESPLVRAARLSKANRKIPKKVLTNADVKKSKGKLAVSSPPPLPAGGLPKADTDKRSPLEKQDAQYRARKAAEERVGVAQKKVDGLEKDLAAIEQSYYEEKDLNRRDDVIQKRFAQAKRQLEEARKELADARDAVSATTPKP